ncbi:hypothetical protein DL768_000531 [Monosporascus sp. mg162]|nr:hypothetical protein DL768_000531 [Monosporascus sp. mg162]
MTPVDNILGKRTLKGPREVSGMGLLGFEILNIKGVAVVLLGGILLYAAYNIFYNLVLHPLAAFQGPLLWRASRIPWTLSLLRGKLVLDSPKMHKEYGPVVRVAPNELARGMYGVPAFLPPHLQNTTNKEHHRALRKALAPGFSDASLRVQESVMAEYIHLLIRRLKEKSKNGALNLELWYRYVIFDIICELAVGESFRCLESDDVHPWIQAIVDGGKAVSFLTAINMYGPLATAINAMECNMDELLSNATVIVGAGAETSAGTLTAVTSLLIDSPEKLEKLTEEVRSAFQSESQITAQAVSRLPYLVACLDESLRLFPQSGSPSLRVADRDTVIGGVPVPKNTIVGIWTYAMYRDPTLWTDPNEFHPERFLGDPKYSNDVREAFKPFFTGSRDCIGQNLALLEMRLILAHMVFNFDMSRTDDPNSENWVSKQKNAYIVWEKTPLPVQLTPVR